MKAILFFLGILSFISLPIEAQAANPPPAKSLSQPTTNTATSTNTSTTTQTPKINLNTADVNTLTQSLKGIGIKRAESIVKYRESLDGGFKAVTDLSQVPLIGKNFVNKHLKEIEEVFAVQ